MLKVLDFEIEKGDKWIKDIPVCDEAGTETSFPFYVIAGEKDGPVLCITSGVHGTEYPGIGANLTLYHEIEPSQLSGTIIGVPQCNFASFQAKVPFVNPLDGKNLNDTFPGDAAGTITERLAIHWFIRLRQRQIITSTCTAATALSGCTLTPFITSVKRTKR